MMKMMENYCRSKINFMALVYVGLIALTVYLKQF
jgi:hypothetical protein